MEVTDFLPFLTMTVFALVPFAWIYLILHTLNWNERANLFLDSWVVFLAFIFSGLTIWISCMSPGIGFYRLFSFNAYVAFFPLTFFATFFSIAAVLKIREKKKDFSIVDISDKKIVRKSVANIWLTSFIVSLLTLAMMTGLVMFVGDISNKFENSNPSPKPANGYTIYD